MQNLENISNQIEHIHSYFNEYANKQVNYAYTLRNWLIGMYLFEYEQNGLDRAEYGVQLYKKIAEKLKAKNVKGLSFTMLNTCKQFYLVYPQIIQTVSEQSFVFDNQQFEIIQTLTEQFKSKKQESGVKSISIENTPLFLSKISFSHILEFIKIENGLQRSFYEIQTIKNSWTVRQLQREINSLLYERIGLSSNKDLMFDKLKNDNFNCFSEIVKSPYILEFHGFQRGLRLNNHYIS